MSNTWKPSTASERIMVKFASHDPSVLVLIKQASFIKKAQEQQQKTDPVDNQGPDHLTEERAAADMRRYQRAQAGQDLRDKASAAWDQALGWVHGKQDAEGNYDWGGAKDLGIGLGTAATLYGATGFIPGLRKQRLIRAMIAAAGGIPTAVYGEDIRNGAQKAWDATSNFFSGSSAKQQAG